MYSTKLLGCYAEYIKRQKDTYSQGLNRKDTFNVMCLCFNVYSRDKDLKFIELTNGHLDFGKRNVNIELKALYYLLCGKNLKIFRRWLHLPCCFCKGDQFH